MRRYIVSLTLVGLISLAGCGRKEPESVPVPEVEAAPELVVLELPLQNQALGITLSDLPSGVVASWSDDDGIMLVEENHRDRRYFLASYPAANLLEPDRYFEDARRRSAEFSGGVQISTGVVQDAPFGLAMWSASRYRLDGEAIEAIEMMSPHPAGQGILELKTTFPDGSVGIDDQIGEMRQLLAHIQPANAG